MNPRFPDVLLVCEETQLSAGFAEILNRTHPESQVHFIHPLNPADWDQKVSLTKDRPKVAFVGLKSGLEQFALGLRNRAGSANIPWIVLLHPESIEAPSTWAKLPYAKVRLNWHSEARENEMQILIDFLETCQFP